MSTGRPQLSVVIPAFNEQDRLARTIPAVDAYFSERDVATEILVVDDGSTDDTNRVAAALLEGGSGRVLRSRENRGKGHAVRRGVLASRAGWVLYTDADLSTPIEEHAKLAAIACEEDLAVAFGSRGLPSSRVELRQSWIRQRMGKTFNRLMREATGLPFLDTQCGFKLLDRERTRPVFERMRIDGFAFDVELLLLAVRLGLRVREVPVVWRNDPRSTVGLLRDPPRILFDVVRVLWNLRRGRYGVDVARAAGGPDRRA